MVDWKEREHEDIDIQEMVEPNSLNALRNCGLLKFLLTPSLQAQAKLLHYLISFCDVNREVFMICDQELEFETLDIYFITGLSQRGELVNIYGSRPIGESVTMLLAEQRPEALKSKTGNIDIMIVRYIALRVLLLTLNKVVWAQAYHQTNK